MTKTLYAQFDGKVFIPEDPLDLEPNIRVRLIIDTSGESKPPKASFLQTARSLKLDGPADWSANLNKYLYGE